jgi:hypothetical protein
MCRVWGQHVLTAQDYFRDGDRESVNTSYSGRRGDYIYDLGVQRPVPMVGAKYKSVPADSVQRVWKFADTIINEATDVYYGR